MEIKELLIKIAGIADKLGIDYAISGGMAVSVWGRPRATFDIDILVKLKEPDIPRLVKELKTFDDLGYIDEEAAVKALERRGEFNFIHSETQLKIDFWIIGNDPLSLNELERKVSKKIGKQNVNFVSPEDLILSKLRWYRESESTRHLEDIESILKISGDKLDMSYLKKWAAEQGTSEVLEKLLKENL